jgi:hypothetical protein
MSELKDGLPTGRLNKDGTLAEINCYKEEVTHTNGDNRQIVRTPCGTRWVPVTDEMRKRIQDASVGIVSMSAVVLTPDMVDSLRTNEPVEGVGTVDAGVRPSEQLAMTRSIEGTGTCLGIVTTTAAEELRPGEYVTQRIAESIAGTAARNTASIDILASDSPVALTSDTSMNLAPLCLDGSTKGYEPTTKSAAELTDRVDAQTTVLPSGGSVSVLPPPDKGTQQPSSYVLAAKPVPCPGTTFVDTNEDRRQHERREFKEENSGGNVNYYCVPIDNPKRPERKPYVFEVEDLIEALNMTFHEGTVLKSLVRSCVERELGMRKVGADYIRDAEKMIHSSQETLRIRKLRAKRGLK